MGIQHLLPLLDNSTRNACISEFENEFVAVDAYCWLHRGIYSCAVELALHKSTTKYVTYCMRYIEMLCHYKVKPILVFDGRELFSKSETEKKRREERRWKFERGKELLRAGNTVEGRKLLGESVDVTHDLAVNLMKECRKKNIDCIVAPYEADAQLAFFSLTNVVKCVITEDSDLLAYGCERVMFKMDTNGNGKLVEKKNLHFSLSMTPEELDDNIFRYICILSGCDYLPSLKSIGPKNAMKFVKFIRDKNIYQELPKLPIYLGKTKLHVTSEYLEGFKIAENTFQHQLVYNPFLRMQVPLKPVKNHDDVVGEKLPEDEAFQLAIGNIDPMTMRKVDDYDPDKCGKGFTLLWRTNSLPKPASRKNILNSSDTLVETKKRQREGQESDLVRVLSNGLKKPCIPLSTSNVAKSFAREKQKIPANGFIFEPKVLSEKKNNLMAVDESKLLSSRYFSVGKPRKFEIERPVETNPVNIKRKGESDEEYSRRLLEYFWTEEKESEESCCCCELSSQSENQCTSRSKCSRCCRCLSSWTEPESQEPDEGTIDDSKSTESVEHSLLDEIHKSEREESNENKTKPEARTPSPAQGSPSDQISGLSSIIEPLEVVDLGEEKSVDKEVIPDARDRSSSPVFIFEKTKSSLKLGNVSDTAATPTSIYFPADPEYSSKTPQVSKATSSTSQRKLGIRASRSMPCRNSVKNPSIHRTLFDFGFKKKDTVVNR